MKPSGYIDGTIAPLNEIRVPILDRGFLYGDSIYEVFRTYAGIPFMFDEHYERLMNSAQLSKMDVKQGKQEIEDAIKATIAAAEVKAGEDIYVRYQITRGGNEIQLHPPSQSQSRLIVMVNQISKWDEKFLTHGISAAIPVVHRNSVNALNPNIKGGNYLNNVLALMEAHAMGVDECVMLDAEGRVTECSNSNVWFVLDGKIVTPANGNLLGLTRKSLVGLLAREGYTEVECEIHSDRLPEATECFVTSATREVMAVASLQLQNGKVLEFPSGGGELTRMAKKLYSEMVANFVKDNNNKAWF